MAVGMDLVKNGEADAFVTAGNTGAGMVTALFRLGRIRGVDRPAIAPIFPQQPAPVLFWIWAPIRIASRKISYNLESWEASTRKKCAASRIEKLD